MPSLMDRVRQALGYHAPDPAEHANVGKRLESQQLRLNALDARIQAQNAATPKRRPERRSVPRA